MKDLALLNPEFYRSIDNPKKGYLSFDCPVCPAEAEHRLQMPTHDDAAAEGVNGAKRWKLTGSPPDWATVSLSPSIDLQTNCRWHGFVTTGIAA